MTICIVIMTTPDDETEARLMAEITRLHQQLELQNKHLQQLDLTLQQLQQNQFHATQTLRDWLLGMLEVYDSFNYGLEALEHYRPVNRLFRHSRPEDIQFIKRIQQGQQITCRRLQRLLQQYQLRPIPCQGRPFDPAVMVAIATGKQPAVADGQVLEEIRPGFYWQDQLLRPAEVKVNKTGESPA